MKFFFTIIFMLNALLYGKENCIFTLPKSGTFLLKTILNELLETDIKVYHLSDIQDSDRDYVISIRDPRDFFVSLKNFYTFIAKECLKKNQNWPGIKPLNYKKYLELSEDDKLLSLISEDRSYYELPSNSLLLGERIESSNSLKYNFDTISSLINTDSVLIIRFEDFIGKRGGGDNLLQKRTIISVLEKFRLQVNPHRLIYALNNFWGKSITFNKGTIGQWKKEYKHFHIEMFKEKWDEYLIDWGYETDYDWNFNYCFE